VAISHDPVGGLRRST